MKEIEALKTSFDSVKKSVSEARKGVKFNIPMPIQENLKDTETHLAECETNQTQVDSFVEALKRDMAELSPRHIPSNEQNAPKAWQDRGKKRSASESPKLNGNSKTCVKPRLTPDQKTAEDRKKMTKKSNRRTSTKETGEMSSRRKKNKKKKRKNLIPFKGLVQQQLPLRSLLEKATLVLGIQDKVNPDDHGVAIRNMTKMRDGNVLIKIGKTDDGLEAFRGAIALALGDSGFLRPLSSGTSDRQCRSYKAPCKE